MTYKNACITSFREKIEVDPIHYDYLIIGEETCPTTGKKHLQCFIQLKTVCRLQKIKNMIGDPEAHIETMKGTALQASEYCKKEGKFKEWGTLRFIGQRTDLDSIKKNVIDTGRIDISIVNNYQQLRFAEGLLKYTEKKRNWKTRVIWIYGPTGTGKTHKAIELSGDNYFISNKSLEWWDGYNGHKNVIIDDYRTEFCKYSELLRILDRYPYRVMFKGGSTELLAEQIVITAPQHPQAMWNGKTDEDLNQLLRRIDLILTSIQVLDV